MFYDRPDGDDRPIPDPAFGLAAHERRRAGQASRSRTVRFPAIPEDINLLLAFVGQERTRRLGSVPHAVTTCLDLVAQALSYVERVPAMLTVRVFDGDAAEIGIVRSLYEDSPYAPMISRTLVCEHGVFDLTEQGPLVALSEPRELTVPSLLGALGGMRGVVLREGVEHV